MTNSETSISPFAVEGENSAISRLQRAIIVNGRYRVDYKIGGGNDGLVYVGTDIESSEEVALKLVPIDEGPWVLDRETSMYEELREGVGIPRVHWYGKQDGYSVMVQELLGPTLVDLLKYCGGRFTLKTVLLIADQAISRIRHIHSKGIMHGDIKPDNLLMGTGKQGNVIYVVDFGLAENFEHPGKNRPFGLAVTFASLNQHRKREKSWSDDLESLGYTLLYLFRGTLPWMGIEASNPTELSEKTMDFLEATSLETLCTGLPTGFLKYMKYVGALEYAAKPDYGYLRGLMDGMRRAHGFAYDHIFDWTEKRYHELKGLERTEQEEDEEAGEETRE